MIFWKLHIFKHFCKKCDKMRKIGLSDQIIYKKDKKIPFLKILILG